MNENETADAPLDWNDVPLKVGMTVRPRAERTYRRGIVEQLVRKRSFTNDGQFIEDYWAAKVRWGRSSSKVRTNALIAETQR